jgi:hypothetical protein
MAKVAIVLAAIQTLFTVLNYFQGAPSERRIVSGKRWPVGLMLLLTLATWSAVAYDIYDRHRSVDMSAWNPMTVIEGKDLSHETVPLDGYKYIRCNLQGATLVYEGQKAAGWEDCQTQGATITSHNLAVAQALFLCQGLVSKGGQIACKAGEAPPSLLPGNDN